MSSAASDVTRVVNVVGLLWKGRNEIRQAHEATHTTMFRNSSPPIVPRRAALELSMRRREPSPAAARSFCKRSLGSAGRGAGPR